MNIQTKRKVSLAFGILFIILFAALSTVLVLTLLDQMYDKFTSKLVTKIFKQNAAWFVANKKYFLLAAIVSSALLLYSLIATSNIDKYYKAKDKSAEVVKKAKKLITASLVFFSLISILLSAFYIFLYVIYKMKKTDLINKLLTPLSKTKYDLAWFNAMNEKWYYIAMGIALGSLALLVIITLASLLRKLSPNKLEVAKTKTIFDSSATTTTNTSNQVVTTSETKEEKPSLPNSENKEVRTSENATTKEEGIKLVWTPYTKENASQFNVEPTSSIYKEETKTEVKEEVKEKEPENSEKKISNQEEETKNTVSYVNEVKPSENKTTTTQVQVPLENTESFVLRNPNIQQTIDFPTPQRQENQILIYPNPKPLEQTLYQPLYSQTNSNLQISQVQPKNFVSPSFVAPQNIIHPQPSYTIYGQNSTSVIMQPKYNIPDPIINIVEDANSKRFGNPQIASQDTLNKFNVLYRDIIEYKSKLSDEKFRNVVEYLNQSINYFYPKPNENLTEELLVFKINSLTLNLKRARLLAILFDMKFYGLSIVNNLSYKQYGENLINYVSNKFSQFIYLVNYQNVLYEINDALATYLINKISKNIIEINSYLPLYQESQFTYDVRNLINQAKNAISQNKKEEMKALCDLMDNLLVNMQTQTQQLNSSNQILNTNTNANLNTNPLYSNKFYGGSNSNDGFEPTF